MINISKTLFFVLLFLQLVTFAEDSPLQLTVEIYNTNKTAGIIPYGGNSQDISGTVSIEDAGKSLRLNGNTWKAIDLSSISITAGSILEFDFSSSMQGEIHGIGFDTDLSISEAQSFKTYGTQIWGLSDYTNYTTSAPLVKSYKISVGQHYTGDFRYLFFACDQDKLSLSAETFISNIRVLKFSKNDFAQTIFEAEDALNNANSNMGTEEGQYSPALIENLSNLLEQARSLYEVETFDSDTAVSVNEALEKATAAFNAGVQPGVLSGVAFGASPSYSLNHLPENVFDSNISTYYQYFTSDNGYVGVDLGEGNGTALTSIKYFPRGDQLNRLKNNKFQGSLDGLTYVDLHVISTESNAEWTEVSITDTTAYRYYRYYDVVGGGDWCSLAEVEFKGFSRQGLYLKQHKVFTFVGTTANQPVIAANLTADHGNLLPQLITYKVLTLPHNGTISLNGEALLLDSTFTQEDINKNLITYSSDASRLDDSLSVEVSDVLGGLLAEVVLDIVIDSDFDGLTDSQEIALGTDYLVADTDGDGLSDFWEEENSLDPLSNNSSQLSSDINGENGLTASYSFGAFRELGDFINKNPAKVEKVSSINFPVYHWNEFANSGVKDYVGAQFKGYLYVPIEGNYKFAMTSDDGSRLYIDGTQVLVNDGLHSAKTIENTINLSAGFHQIKCEYFERTGSQVCILQWAGPNRALEVIPASFYFISLDEHQAEIDSIDRDQDGLTDALEVQEGSDPENPDTDGDRLLDGEEYHAMYNYKTNPLSIDTDSDTVSDYDEIFVFKSNPLIADFDGSILESISIIPAETTSRLGEWEDDGDEVFAKDRRGALEYTVDIKVPGIYRFDVVGAQNTTGTKRPLFDLHLHIDGEFVERLEHRIQDDEQKKYSFITPYLSVGSHEIRIFWNNVYKHTSLRVKSLELSRPGGPDSNDNGNPDWVDSYIETNYSLDDYAASSIISPAQIEGKGRYLYKINASFSDELQRGTYNRWFANVTLASDSPTEFRLDYEDGLKSVNGAVTWVETNILDEGEVTIPLNSSMLLNAIIDGDLESTSVIKINDGSTEDVFNANANNPIEYKFTKAGIYTVQADYTGSEIKSATLTVNVVGITEVDAPYIWRGKERSWSWPGLGSDIHLEATGMDFTPNGSGFLLKRMEVLADVNIVARLGSGGPILKSLPTLGFWLRDAVEGYLTVVDTYEDGSKLTNNMALSHQIPKGMEIKVSTISGVTFLDGSRNIVLTKDDFDELGQWTLELLKSIDRNGASCHWYKVYQNGVLVGQQNK